MLDLKRSIPLFALALAGVASRGASQSLSRNYDGLVAGDRAGAALAGIVDLDGDGYDELAVGAPGAAGTGLVRVFSGRTGLILRTFSGADPGEEFGAAVADAGDLDADGVHDVVVGAPRNTRSGPDSGRVYSFSGRTGGLLWVLDGPTANDFFGTSVAAAGDVDGDGYDDVIAGAPGEFGNGTAYTYRGFDGLELHRFRGSEIGEQFGFAVAGVGDLDGDGLDDVVIGAPCNDFSSVDAGRVQAFAGLSGSLLYTIDGPTFDDRFGYSLAALGDVTGDGVGDWAVGAPREFGAGTAYVYGGVDGAYVRRFTGNNIDDRFGHAVANVGDLDGDGLADVGVGAPQEDVGGVDTGSVTLYSGRDGHWLGSATGGSAGAQLGTAVASAGDSDHDAFAELAAGAPGAAPNGAASGNARIYDLNRSGTPADIEAYGRGCIGTGNRVPRILVSATPRLGRPWTLRLRGGAPNRLALCTLAIPENVALDSLGYPGCSAYALNGSILFQHTTNALGIATQVLPIPSDPALVGLRIGSQWTVADPTANAGGATTSAGLLLVLGH